MIKTKEYSRIEVWATTYINNRNSRIEEDKEAEIVQIEFVSGVNFIVEIVRPSDREAYYNNSHGIVMGHIDELGFFRKSKDGEKVD